MFVAALAAALVSLTPQSAPTSQDPSPSSEPVALEDIVVTGRPLNDLIRDFVGEVAAPNRNRSLARWDSTVCVGVANLKADAAQYIADRVSTVAQDVGLKTGQPGCSPNILVVATDNGEALARGLVEERPRAFRMGGAGMDRGAAALRRFQDNPKPVRWWQMAMPVDSETGQRAVRIPGECGGACQSAADYAPVVNVFAASRLNGQIVDNLIRAIVVVDVDQIGDVSVVQLADYIAMVSLAQIDPEADSSAYASVLNVFDDPISADGLTNWDKTYLAGLYGAERDDRNLRAGQAEVARSIGRAHQQLRESAPDAN